MKIINYKFKKKNSIGNKEISSAIKVLKSGELSGFMGSSGPNFLGGKYVRNFEEKIKKFYNVKYAISVNSWTSGLIAAVGSLNVEPGDEIIVTPWTMCATATAILHWNCIPVFADIDENTFCIDPQEIKKKITSKTRAIIAVDIFGHPADIDNIKKIIKNKKSIRPLKKNKSLLKKSIKNVKYKNKKSTKVKRKVPKKSFKDILESLDLEKENKIFD